MSELIYLYGFVPAQSAEPQSLEGMSGAGVRLVARDDLAAVVSDVPSDSFTAASIEERMDDLDWVGQQGLSHERVVSWFVDHGDIVPVPLFTLYSGPDVLYRELELRADTVRGHLQRIAGRREWDLKLVYDAAKLAAGIAAASPDVRALDEEMSDASPGRRFLLQRKRHDLARSEARRVAAARSDALFRDLGSIAEDARQLSIARTGDALPVLLHAAFLVRRERETELAGALAGAMRDLEPLGFAASLTGPWAPYRFLEDAP